MREILCFGDSNTYGLIPKTGGRYDRNTRWTGILERRLYEKDYRIVEEGLCGRTTVFEDELREGRRGASLLPTLFEYSRAMKSHFRKSGNQMSRKWKSSYASLLA